MRMIFVGYAEGRKAYRSLDPSNDWIVISRGAKFLESDGVKESKRIISESSGGEFVVPESPKPIMDASKDNIVVSLESNAKQVLNNLAEAGNNQRLTEPEMDDSLITI